MPKPKKNCTPEEMELRTGGPWNGVKCEMPFVHTGPRDRCIIEPIPGKEMEVVPLKARAGRSDLINEMKELKVKFGNSHYINIENGVLTVQPYGTDGEFDHMAWLILKQIPGLKRVVAVYGMGKSHKKLVKKLNRKIRRQRMKRFFKRITPLAWALISSIMSTQLLLISLKIAGILDIEWIFVWSPIWMTCSVSFVIGVLYVLTKRW